MKPSTFTGLGQALRWLRERQTRKQYQVAERAGITKGMLSAYETGRQRPSLETLDKLLDTLGCDLNDLHNAIQIVNGRPEAIRRFVSPASRTPSAGNSAGAPPNGAAGGGLDPGLTLRGRSYAPAGDFSCFGGLGPPSASGSQEAQDDPYPQEGSERVSEVREPSELYRVLGRPALLPESEERALAQMLDGFHQLIRYWDQALERLRRARTAAGDLSPEPAEP